MARIAPGLRTRLTRAERMVGWFVGVATVGLLVAFVAFVYDTAERKGNFEPKAYYQTSIMNAAGLKVGDPVKMMGFDVGEITAVVPNGPYEYYRVTIEFYVRQGRENRYFDYIWTDSKAKIASADMLGNRFIEVVKGQYGLKTVWQPDPGSKELMRLDQLVDKNADKVKLDKWQNETYADELVKYRKWHTIKNMSREEVRAAELTYSRWYAWTNRTTSFPEIEWEAVSNEWSKAGPYLEKKKPDAFKKATEPYLAFLADALGPDKLKAVYPTDATKGGDYRDPNSPKPYYLDSEESEALGDIITKVADQVNSVVGKPGAIGDLVINDDIRKLFARLETEGAVGDMVMNDELKSIVADIQKLTTRLASTNKGVMADLFLSQDLKGTVEELTCMLNESTAMVTELKETMKFVNVAIAQNSASTNGLTPAVATLPDLKRIAAQVAEQMEKNPDAVSNSVVLVNSVSKLVETVDRRLNDTNLTAKISNLATKVDGIAALFEYHWLFRKAAARRNDAVVADWERAGEAILGIGDRAASLRATIAAVGATADSVRPKIDEIAVAASHLAELSDRLNSSAGASPTRVAQLTGLTARALDLERKSYLELKSELDSSKLAAAILNHLETFLEDFDENSLVHKARSDVVVKSEEKPKRKFFRNPFTSRGSRNK